MPKVISFDGDSVLVYPEWCQTGGNCQQCRYQGKYHCLYNNRAITTTSGYWTMSGMILALQVPRRTLCYYMKKLGITTIPSQVPEHRRVITQSDFETLKIYSNKMTAEAIVIRQTDRQVDEPKTSNSQRLVMPLAL